MKRTMIICNILLVAAALFNACGIEEFPDDGGKTPNERKDIVLTKVQEQIGYNANAFTFDFLKAACAKEQKGTNIFVSPFSIQMALAMTAAGAAGDTQTEMYNALGFNNFTGADVSGFYHTLIPALQAVDNTTTFEIANSFWARNSIKIKDNYISDIKDNFYAEVRTLPAGGQQAAGEINGWCSEKTHGMINKIVDEVPSSTIVSLLNAIYFKGIWKDKFSKDANTQEKFTNFDGTTVKATFMNKTFDSARVYSDEYAEAMSIPYGNGAFAMTIVMPRTGVSLDKILAGLNAETWAAYRDGGRTYEVVFAMPKFEEEYAAEKLCIEILQGMGMNKAFTGAADFSAMSDTPLCIDEIRHKAKIKVDEEGTEAAAVTYIGMRVTSVGPGGQIFYFKADRPFLYFISERSTGEILFSGAKNLFK
ncbi:MAG: serpin family protein [Bacteroidales bacterium]|nr:serpin family protein [Bacteroidales bacterium]